MAEQPARTVKVYEANEVVRIQVDAPGERAVSAPVPDVLALIIEIAKTARFEVDDTVPGEVYISWPAG